MEPWLSQLLQATDSSFPTGAYAHSLGLEGAVQDGLVTGSEELGSFLAGVVVPGLRQLELPAVAHAWRFARDRSACALSDLDRRYAALKGSRETREASARVGAQRFDLLRELVPHPFWEELEVERRAGRLGLHEVVVLGAHGALIEASLETTMTAAFYQALAVQVSAALKLIRIGQVGCQKLIARFMAGAGETVAVARDVSIDDMGWFSPGLDIASARHETAYTRLFIS